MQFLYQITTDTASKAASFDALSPLTTLGDVLYGGTSGTGTRLAGNATATKKFLTQTGTGTASAAPAWGTISTSDVSGLGTIATQAASSVSITGGTISGVTFNSATINTSIHPVTSDSDSAGTTTLDLSVTDEHATTLSANTTFAFSNATVGQRFTLRIQQASSGGPYTISWGSLAITWFTATFAAPTMPTGAGNAMVVTFKCTGSGTYDGFLAGTSGS